MVVAEERSECIEVFGSVFVSLTTTAFQMVSDDHISTMAGASWVILPRQNWEREIIQCNRCEYGQVRHVLALFSFFQNIMSYKKIREEIEILSTIYEAR